MADLRPIDRWFIDEVLPYERSYLAVALRLAHDREEAREIVQDAFVKLFSLDGWSAIESPPGYVIRMVRNLAIERMRRARVVSFQQLTEIDGAKIEDDAPGPFREAAGRDEVRRLAAAVDALPEVCRTVVLRRRFGNESPTEIASATGTSISTLEKRLARGMQMLAAALSLDGGVSPRRRARTSADEKYDKADTDDAASG